MPTDLNKEVLTQLNRQGKARLIAAVDSENKGSHKSYSRSYVETSKRWQSNNTEE
jgi:hypothetical protein